MGTCLKNFFYSIDENELAIISDVGGIRKSDVGGIRESKLNVLNQKKNLNQQCLWIIQ